MKKRNETAVLGVIFPGVKSFIDEYLCSLVNQDFKEFDLVILNDGFVNFQDIKKRFRLNIEEIERRGSPAEIREFGINYLREKGYKYIVFTDTDDFFESNRIKESLKLLKNHDIVVNDVHTCSDKKHPIERLYMSERLKDLSDINQEFILDKNIFGFSNTAIKAECLTKNVKFEKSLVAVDWYFFTALLQKRNAVFTNKTATFYRIYEGNTVGLSYELTPERIKKGLEVKSMHYKLLSETNSRYKSLFLSFESVKNNISDIRYMREYLKNAKSLRKKKPFWWEEIRLPENVGNEVKVNRK